MLNDEFQIVRDLIGKPYLEFGRGPDSYDCYGILIESAKRYSIKIPDYGDFSNNKNFNESKELIDFNKIHYEKIKSPEFKSIILFRILNHKLHLAFMITDKHFIHTTEELGCHIVPISHPIWNRLIEGFYRCKMT